MRIDLIAIVLAAVFGSSLLAQEPLVFDTFDERGVTILASHRMEYNILVIYS